MATTRQRCTVTGCNPLLVDLDEAAAHRDTTGHRTAAWPTRPAEGKRLERQRNRTGYHRKYQLAREERQLNELIAASEEEDRVEAVNAMTPKTREQTKSADEAFWARLDAGQRGQALQLGDRGLPPVLRRRTGAVLMREMTSGAIFLMEAVLMGRLLVSLFGIGRSLALPLDAEIISWDTLIHLRKIL
ncbi:hypothetical protein [Kocuria sp. CPCC 205263]|uniref:hypothetical protein n=1 Tax=Kocuria sp. CPCC 205263 TaxID=3073555 RepID=UPI0034D4CCEF